MASCFGIAKHTSENSSFNNENVYPPPIIIEKYIAVPGFIREGRQLSKALSLDLYSFEDSISITTTDSSIKSNLVSLFSENQDSNEKINYKDNNKELYHDSSNEISVLIEKPKSNHFNNKNNNKEILEINCNSDLNKNNTLKYNTDKIHQLEFNKVNSNINKKKSVNRKRILSAPNESITHINQNTNNTPNLETHKSTIKRNRTPSLKLLVQSVIQLMNKRGSKGRTENVEIKEINNIINNIKYDELSNSTLSSNSILSSNSSSISLIQNQNSINQLIKKQVSFELDTNNKKKSNSITKKISNLFKKKSNSNIYINPIKKSSNIIQNNIQDNIQEETVSYISTTPINQQLENIKEYKYSIIFNKSISTESISSNFSTDQRVANTYDMQIITYDQSAIPIPNIPKGKKLQSLEYFENCYILITPKIKNLLSSCY